MLLATLLFAGQLTQPFTATPLLIPKGETFSSVVAISNYGVLFTTQDKKYGEQGLVQRGDRIIRIPVPIDRLRKILDESRWNVAPLRISDQGAVVGSFNFNFSGAFSGAICVGFYRVKNKTTLMPPEKEFVSSFATGSNKSGEVVGIWDFTGDLPHLDFPQDQLSHAFLWRKGKFTDLGLGTSVQINDNGVIAISAPFDPTGKPMTSAWTKEGQNRTQKVRLWQNGESQSLGVGEVVAISNRGNVLLAVGDHIEVWTNGKRRVIRGQKAWTLIPKGFNDRGDIVGISKKQEQELPFLFTRGKIIDLSKSCLIRKGSALIEANGINSYGQIAATATNVLHSEGFILNPVLK